MNLELQTTSPIPPSVTPRQVYDWFVGKPPLVLLHNFLEVDAPVYAAVRHWSLEICPLQTIPDWLEIVVWNYLNSVLTGDSLSNHHDITPKQIYDFVIEIPVEKFIGNDAFENLDFSLASKTLEDFVKTIKNPPVWLHGILLYHVDEIYHADRIG